MSIVYGIHTAWYSILWLGTVCHHNHPSTERSNENVLPELMAVSREPSDHLSAFTQPANGDLTGREPGESSFRDSHRMNPIGSQRARTSINLTCQFSLPGHRAECNRMESEYRGTSGRYSVVFKN